MGYSGALGPFSFSVPFLTDSTAVISVSSFAP